MASKSKRAPALGRKVKSGPRERDLGYPLHRRLPGETVPYEPIYGTAVMATQAYPFDSFDGSDEAAGRLLQQIFAAPEHRDGPPHAHTLALPQTEDEMAAEPPPSFTLEAGP